MPSDYTPESTLKPSTHGSERAISMNVLVNAIFFRDRPVKSILHAMIVSKTAMTVEKAAKAIKIKKRLPQIRPPAILLKIFGSVINSRFGPLPASNVMDGFAGANKNTRLKIRFIMEVAWQAHFVKNMFIRPTEQELADFGKPDFVVYTASKAKVDNYKELGINSETAVVFNLTSQEQIILNTWYGGEMKKGMFSIMNYLLPLKGVAAMHCSANTNEKGETAVFFGLSGTGKTTLSTNRSLLASI